MDLIQAIQQGLDKAQFALSMSLLALGGLAIIIMILMVLRGR